MAKIKKTIEIVRSVAPGLKSLGDNSSKLIQAILSKKYDSVIVSNISSRADLDALICRKPDMVFAGMKFITLFDTGTPVRVWLAELLDAHDIAYTGSGALAYQLEHDKQSAKRRIDERELETASFQVIKNGVTPTVEDIELEYPIFIKPTSSGGGFGVDSQSYALDFDALKNKIQSLNSETKSDILLEEYLSGREFSVAILKDINTDGFSVMPLELIAPMSSNGARILSAEIKEADTEEFVAVTDLVVRARICTLAIDSFVALGAKDFGRIDIRLNSRGVPHFLEANLIPSLAKDYGNFPKACKLNLGMEYEEVISRIVQLGFNSQEEVYTNHKSTFVSLLGRQIIAETI